MPSPSKAVSLPAIAVAEAYGPNVSKGILAMEERIRELESKIDEKKDANLHVPDHIKSSLIKYAEAERKRMKNPVVRDMITWKSTANHILRVEMERKGYRER